MTNFGSDKKPSSKNKYIEGNDAICEDHLNNPSKPLLDSVDGLIDHRMKTMMLGISPTKLHYLHGNDVTNLLRRAKEVHNVVFVKVHKAASTTMTNIILRFGVSRRLNIMVPKETHLINETYFTINEKCLVPRPPGDKYYNIVGNHLLFNEFEIKRFFPPNVTKFIGIIRDPFQQFNSAFSFYATIYKDPRYMRVIQENQRNPIHGFLKDPERYDNVPANITFTNNRMSVDLGFPVDDNFEKNKNDPNKIKEFVKYIDKTFYLMLIVELFDESIILMRRMLKWTTQDILYIRKNTQETNSMTMRIRFAASQTFLQDAGLYQKWARLDYELYNHFHKKLRQMIGKQPSDFRQELMSFRVIKKKVNKFCIRMLNLNKSKFYDKGIRTGGLGIDATPFSPGFCVTYDYCRQLNMNEMDVTHMARKWQRRKAGLDIDLDKNRNKSKI